MNKRAFSLRVATVFASLLVGVHALTAQTENLLVNGGFEAPFVDQGGEPARQVADGWTAWHLPAAAGAPVFQNQQPEYLPTAPNSSRIFSGTDAQMMNSYYTTHVAGVYQQVSGAVPGTSYTFSANAYVWSTTGMDPNVSADPGIDTIQVGIDPMGGTDATSPTIVWSSPVEAYDAYTIHTVSAVALADTITVFTRSSLTNAVAVTNVFFDDAVLIAGASTVIVTTEEPIAAVTDEVTSEPVVETEVAAPVETEAVVVTEIVTEAVVDVTQEPIGITTLPPTDVVVVVTEEPTTEPATETPTVEPTIVEATVEVVPTIVEPSATPLPTIVEATVTPTAAATTASGAQVSAQPTVPPTPRPTVDPVQFPYTIVYKVTYGDTVARLAGVYGSTISAINSANNLNAFSLIYVGQSLVIPVRVPPTDATALPVTAVPTATPSQEPGSGTFYVVQPGDTLLRIARVYNTTVSAIARLNGILNPDRILVGQRLQIPAATQPTPTATPTQVPPEVPATYLVVPGDTLYRISLRFNIPVAQLVQLNAIVNPDIIYVGQVLALK